MNSLFKSAVLSFAVAGMAMPAPPAWAAGSKPPSNSNPGNGSDQANQVIDLALALAIGYAKTDPRYAPILTALGINTPQDLRNFLKGGTDGSNFRNILARLAFLQGQSNPQVRDWLAKLGITNEQQLRDFLKNNGQGASFETILSLALAQAQSNPKYTTWLSRLGIRDVQDFRNLLRGTQSGNLQSLILMVGLHYVESNPKYAQYAPMIRAALVALGLSQGDDGTGNDGSSDDDIIDLGVYKGMTVGEVKAVRKK